MIVLCSNIEELCRFPGLPQRKQLSYSAKQLISREVVTMISLDTVALFMATGGDGENETS